MRWVAGASVSMIVLALATSAAAQTRDENIARCDSDDPDLRISGCTAFIQSGRDTAAILAIAFNQRGIA